MGLSVIEQWKSELRHCIEWSNSAGVERAVAELRALGVDVTDDGALVEGSQEKPGTAPRRGRGKGRTADV